MATSVCACPFTCAACLDAQSVGAWLVIAEARLRHRSGSMCHRKRAYACPYMSAHMYTPMSRHRSVPCGTCMQAHARPPARPSARPPVCTHTSMRTCMHTHTCTGRLCMHAGMHEHVGMWIAYLDTDSDLDGHGMDGWMDGWHGMDGWMGWYGT